VLYKASPRRTAEPVNYYVYTSPIKQLAVMLSNEDLVQELRYPELFSAERTDLGTHLYNSAAWQRAMSPPQPDDPEDVINLRLMLYFDPVNYGTGGIGGKALGCNQIFLFIANLRQEIMFLKGNITAPVVSTGFHVDSAAMSHILARMEDDFAKLCKGVRFVLASGKSIYVRARVHFFLFIFIFINTINR